MDRHCYYITDPDIGRVLIPGCYGAAIYGKRGCTCPKRQTAKSNADIEQRLAQIEKILSKLAAA